MDRDDFIIQVYCLVCEHYDAVVKCHYLRQRGFAKVFTDEKALTLEICGEYFGFDQDEALYAYFADHYRHFFPPLSQPDDLCASSRTIRAGQGAVATTPDAGQQASQRCGAGD